MPNTMPQAATPTMFPAYAPPKLPPMPPASELLSTTLSFPAFLFSPCCTCFVDRKACTCHL
ncbi:hypothetical protein PpSQ1_05285 [Pseudomonas putida]|nr:hypothetical protein PpSQ1_05285 [Pseudomonas putida]